MTNERVLEELSEWENSLQIYKANDFEMIYDSWMKQGFEKINPSIQANFFEKLDNILFHTHAYLQGSNSQNEARERIITTSRIFNPHISHIHEMNSLKIEQLTYLAQQHISKGRLYSLVQGGITGTGGIVLLGVDFPLVMVMNLRVVQLIALTFGHEVNHPYEMMLSLKVYHAATLPKRLQKQAWDELVKELETDQAYLYEGNDALTNHSWLDQPLKQASKSLFILMARKKIFQGIPILSIGIGAYYNYQLTRQVANFALRFYQKRYILATEKV
ncbi:EcsC family protein [Radiobacillus sp. PE A8.2]|uniref:EcsC family protein n=1 Tax=Radiobacillus sp. PE A8.2 TaxID=3380349 RepID=UPI00388F06A0